MEKYFDAFLYVANWGTHALHLRFPRRVLDPSSARRYCRGEVATLRTAGEFIILEISSDDETGGDWSDDGSGWLSSLIPLRADIAGGDYRALYLAWLLCAQLGELGDDVLEPPLPPGLGKLTAPLEALVDFLRIDRDLVAVATERSPEMARSMSPREIQREVAALPQGEKTKLLVRLAAGEENHLRAQLMHCLGNAHRRPHGSASQPRTVTELLAAAERRAKEREREEVEQAARDRILRERHVAATRELYLNRLRKRQTETWQKIQALIETRTQVHYDAALGLLKDLKDLATRDGRTAEVAARCCTLAKRHMRKPSLLQRLKKARLI
jgi:hypothetical protein